jgi:hypothetical protein
MKEGQGTPAAAPPDPARWVDEHGDYLYRLLSLRLLDDVPALEVCQTFGISATNLWTLLHRARLRLWHCLDGKGLGTHPGGG